MRERAKSFYVVFAIAASLIVPAAIALRTIVHPAILQATSDNPTPLGYTWSLALFIIPIGVLSWWFGCPSCRLARIRNSVLQVFVQHIGRVSVVLYLSYLRSAGSVCRLFLHRATIHQLARLQLNIFSAAPYEFAVGSDSRLAVWLVGIPQ